MGSSSLTTDPATCRCARGVDPWTRFFKVVEIAGEQPKRTWGTPTMTAPRQRLSRRSNRGDDRLRRVTARRQYATERVRGWVAAAADGSGG